ncbi:MAG: MFS transporter [Kiritimatiellae bacterium]|nr:MFS transporter [Kiritimatiellia bacterium]
MLVRMEPGIRRHLILNAAGEALWGFGGNLAAPLTVLTLVVARLGGGNFEIGLLNAIGAAGILFPQLLSTLVLQRGTGRRTYLIRFHYLAILPPWVLIGLLLLLVGDGPSLAGRIALPLLYAAYVGSIGFVLPVWFDWIVGFFPRDVRGQAFGWAAAASAAGAALAAVCAGLLARRLDYPLNYALLFFIGAICFLVSMSVYTFMREPASLAVPPTLTARQILGRFRQSLAGRNYRTYLIARLLLTAGAGPIGFFAVHYRGTAAGAVPERTLIALGAVIYVSQAIMSWLLGRIGDRFGHRLGALIGALSQVGGLGIAILMPGAVGAGAAFLMTGVGIAAAWVSHQNLLFETCPHDCRSAHITITNLVLAPLTTLVPLVTGRMIEAFGSRIVFAWCLLPTVLGLAWFLFAVRDPRVADVTGASAGNA